MPLSTIEEASRTSATGRWSSSWTTRTGERGRPDPRRGVRHPEAINFMARHGRGLICLSITEEKAQSLQLPDGARHSSAFGTAFTVSIEARRGVSTASRPTTGPPRSAPHRETAKPEDLVRPGHVFPIIARKGGFWCARGRRKGRSTSPASPGAPPPGDLRDHERGRHDGADARPRTVLRGAQPPDRRHQGPDRAPDARRAAGGAHR